MVIFSKLVQKQPFRDYILYSTTKIDTCINKLSIIKITQYIAICLNYSLDGSVHLTISVLLIISCSSAHLVLSGIAPCLFFLEMYT